MDRSYSSGVVACAVDQTTDARFIDAAELRTRVPASDMTFWRWIRDPRVNFPAPVKLGADGKNYWWLPEIQEWERLRRQRPSTRKATGRRRPPAKQSGAEISTTE